VVLADGVGGDPSVGDAPAGDDVDRVLVGPAVVSAEPAEDASPLHPTRARARQQRTSLVGSGDIEDTLMGLHDSASRQSVLESAGG
jgi:hypothetical protein